MIRLSRRLETIVSAAADCLRQSENGTCVADIGTDHGFVPISLVEQGAAERALAMDVRQGPLDRAREHIRERGLEAKIETRLSDGLRGLTPGEAQVVVIAGMGGELMLRILREGAALIPSVSGWVLSPQSELAAFRHGLEELGLAIRDEVMVEEDGKTYTVITAGAGQFHYEEECSYRFGECLIQARSPVLLDYLLRQRKLLEEICRGLSGRPGEAAKARLRELEQELADTERAICRMK